MLGHETYSRIVASVFGPRSGVPAAENFPEGLHFTPVTAPGTTATWLKWGRVQLPEVMAKLIESGFLPTRLIPDQKAFEDLGFRFGWIARDNHLIRETTLPDSWTLRADASPISASILDDAGTVRARAYYEASDDPQHRSACIMIIDPISGAPA